MTERSHLMDVLRVGAAHVIVLHHLTSYGPLAGTLEQVWPWLFGVLYNYGRFATQVFFVMAGFLAAQGLLASHALPLGERLAKRYLRLVPAFLLAILAVALVVTGLRPWIDQDWLTEPPTLWQLVTHVLLIQDLVGQPAMTVGAWYVAIEFQLFAALNILAWTLRRMDGRRAYLIVCVATLCLSSQWYFNRDPAWDRWALYFFESYGLGAMLALALHRPSRRVGIAHACLLVCIASSLAAAWIYPRPRLVLSVVVCMLLWWGVQRWQPSDRPLRWLRRHSDASYSLFLTHFMPLVVANAVWINAGGESPALGLTLLLLTWWLCVPWSVLFHRLTLRVVQAARRN